MKFINTSKTTKAKASYTQAVESNGFLFISGQLHIITRTDTSIDRSILEKTIMVMNNIGNILIEERMDYSI
jgi:enamine deaminase RidA (YjgF/YER057c/UK114 family)